MDEIEVKILSVIESSPNKGLEVAQVAKELEDRYNTSINTKRVRHKMDSLCKFKYLSKTSYKASGARGPERYLYTIHEEEC